MYHQIKLFLLTRLRDAFMFPRRIAKVVIYGRICLGHTSEIFMVSVQNSQVIKISQVLVFHVTKSFSGCLQSRIFTMALFCENT